MAVYERFQKISAARQELFSPDSPVWVSRYQLSRDLESGMRLLQTRMVNCSDRTVRQVFLRVVCFGASRERLTQLELVPMASFNARPGEAFGDDRPVELPVKGAVYVEAYAQRVRFADGSAWDEADPAGYLAFHAAPVDPEDPHAELLADRARSGGVRNDCYFTARQGLWVCTCGLPNALRNRRCARCGADRVWLERHMDPNLIDAPAPEPTPAPVVIPPPAPQITVVPAPIREEPAPQPTFVVQPAPEPPVEEAPASHGARNALIAAAALLLLLLGAFCAYRFLMPWLRYREAVSARSAGEFDKAVTLFTELGDYRDSPEQIRQTRSRKAARLMEEKQYREALDIYESLADGDRVADCLYALGVLAYNDKDLDTALNYVEQLRSRFPDYENTDKLASYCYYSLGNQSAAEAAEQTEPFLRRQGWQQAYDNYARADGYEDSGQRMLECDYQIALSYIDENDLEKAVECLEALGDYADAEELKQVCMYDYLQANLSNYYFDSGYMRQWLEQLVNAGYPGAEALSDRLNGVGCYFALQYGSRVLTDGEKLEAPDLGELGLYYSVEPVDNEGPILVLARYTLPNGVEGRALLNEDRSAEGVRLWKDVPFPVSGVQDGKVTLRFYDAALGENSTPLEVLSLQFEQKQGETGEAENAAGEGQNGPPQPGSGENSRPSGGTNGSPPPNAAPTPTGENSPRTGA